MTSKLTPKDNIYTVESVSQGGLVEYLKSPPSLCQPSMCVSVE